jgi:uncharacterized RDD family membrane protein YckC
VLDGLLLSIPNYTLGRALGLSSFVIPLVYFMFFWTARGATLGNQVVKTKIVTTDGTPLTRSHTYRRLLVLLGIQIICIELPLLQLLNHISTYQDSSGRTMVSVLPGGPFWMGVVGLGLVIYLVNILWPLWDPRKQTLHDKVAGTLVVTR